MPSPRPRRGRSPSLEESYHLLSGVARSGASSATTPSGTGGDRGGDGDGDGNGCAETSFFASPHAPVSGGSYRVRRSSSYQSVGGSASGDYLESGGARVPLLSDENGGGGGDGGATPPLSRLLWYQVRRRTK